MEAREMTKEQFKAFEMTDIINELIGKQLAQKEKELFQKLIDSGKVTSEFVFIANPSAKPLIAEMKANGFDVYCLFDSYVKKDKMYLVTDKELEDRIKSDLK